MGSVLTTDPPGAEAGTIPIDRHIAAFIAAKLARPIERELTQFANPADQAAYRLGILRVLAAVQRQHPNHDLPRLADRSQDIPLLMEHFIKQFSKRHHKKIESVSAAARRRLLAAAS